MMMLDEYIEYFVAIAPILIGHLIIPPISHYIGTEKYPPALEFLYNLRPSAIRSIQDLESLMYKTSLPLDSIQIITHMFVHSDTKHLLNNIDAILYSGYPVFREFGIRGLYTTFLLGGISAIIPSPLYDIQKDGNVSKLEKLVSLQDSPISSVVPKSILSWFDKPLKEVAKGVGNAYYKITSFYMCGSSGGSCALIGCDLIFVIRDSFKLVTKAYKSYQISNNNNGNINRLNNRDENRLSNREKFLLLQYGLCTIKTLSYFTKELNMVYGNGTSGVFFDTINHAAHLQGSLFGMAFGVVFGVAVPYIQRNRSILL
jgi:membrane associated rhomboid family serine protease